MAIIKCPECGKEVSDQAEACIYCGYPLKTATNLVELVGDNVEEVEVVSTTPTVVTSTVTTSKVDAYDVMILEYNSLKLTAKKNLVKLCGITSSEAGDILDSLPCYIYDDIEKEEAEEIARRLMNVNFRIAVYDPVGNVRYFEPPHYINRPLPTLVPAPRRKRRIIKTPIAPRPRAVKMPKNTPSMNVGLKPNNSSPMGNWNNKPKNNASNHNSKPGNNNHMNSHNAKPGNNNNHGGGMGRNSGPKNGGSKRPR